MPIPMGNFSDFVGGFLEAQGNRQARQDKIDDAIKEAWGKVAPQSALDDAKEQYRARREVQVKSAAANNDVAGQQLSGYQAASNNFQTAPNPAGTAGMQPVPGAPQPSAPIQPRTMEVAQNEQQPQPQAPAAQPQQQGQAPQAPTPNLDSWQGQGQGGMNSPQGGPVPLQGDMAPPPSENIPPSAPASQAILATNQKSAETGDPVAQLRAKYVGGPAGNDEFDKVIASAKGWGITDPSQLEALIIARSQMAKKGDGDKFYDTFLPKFAADSQKQALHAPDAVKGDLQQAVVNSMTQGGNPPKLTPLNAAQLREKDSYVKGWDNADQAIEKGLNNIAEISSVIGKTYRGPNFWAEGRATVANMWSGLWGGQPSEEASNTSEFQKGTGNLTNQLMQSLKGLSRMGPTIYNLEAKNVPELSKPDAANLEIVRSIGAGLIYNRDLIDGAKTLAQIPNITSDDIRGELMRYSENNPPFLKDGKTPNPDRMSYQEWINSGSQHGKVTGKENRDALQGSIESKLGAAKVNKNPANVGNEPTKQGWKYLGPVNK